MKRIITIILAIALVFAVVFSVKAQNSALYDYTKNESEKLYALALENNVVQFAGDTSADWTIIAAARGGQPLKGAKQGLSSSVDSVLSKGGYKKTTDALRVILALCSVSEGYFDSKASALTDEHVFKNPKLINAGINAKAFALMVINGCPFTAPQDAEVSEGRLIDSLLSAQLTESGGFCLSGNIPDVDVTAIVVTALAPYYTKNKGVAEAIEAALDYLSRVQCANGGFKSYGQETCESSAQTIIALTTLGIDPVKDGRFIKNGKTIFDALNGYKTTGGEYSHLHGGKANGMASSQAYLAYVSYMRFLKAEAPIYAFTGARANVYNKIGSSKPAVNPQEGVTSATSDSSAVQSVSGSNVIDKTTSSKPVENADIIDSNLSIPAENAENGEISTTEAKDDSNISGCQWRKYFAVFLAVVSVVLLCTAVCLGRKRTKQRKKAFRRLFSISVACALIAVLLFTVKIQSKEEYSSLDTVAGNTIGTVTLTVDCSILADNDCLPENLSDSIPKNGKIIDNEQIELYENDSPFSVLKRATKEKGIQLEFNGGGSAYVEGIGYLYEFDFGDLSGWIYTVNGSRPDTASSEYTLKNKDNVCWVYSLNLGEDVTYND